MSIYQVRMSDWFGSDGDFEHAEVLHYLIKHKNANCIHCNKPVKFETGYCLHSGPYSGYFDFTCPKCYQKRYSGDKRKARRMARERTKGTFGWLRKQEHRPLRKIERRRANALCG